MGMKTYTFGFAALLSCTLYGQQSNTSFERKNLGANINSKANEMTPRISADGKTLFFVRDGHPKNKNTQDIWYSELGDDGHWKEAVRAGSDLNKVDGNCVWSVNADGNSVLIRGAFVDGTFRDRGFSLTRQTKDGWTPPQLLKIDSLDKMDHGLNDGAYLSVDGNAIVFTLCEKQNCHVYDLYVSTKREDGSFTKPRKMLDSISTEFNEFAPFIAADNKTLYFSSDRPGGLGHTDIYKAERLDSTWLNWSGPTNLGAPINTAEKEGYYATDAKSEYGYLVSDLNTYGGADIVRIKLSEEQRHNPVAMLDGQVLDAKTKAPVRDARIEYNVYPNDTDEGIAHSDHTTGQYKVVLPYGENYAINIIAKGYVPYYDTLTLKNEGEYKEVKRNFYLIPLEVGQTIVMKHIYFESSKYELLTESYYELDKVIQLLHTNKHMEIEVGGHTDDVGKDEDNLALSQNRATAVMIYIVSKGIEARRITAKGYGETKPIVANDTDENKQLNRRVEFTIKKK